MFLCAVRSKKTTVEGHWDEKWKLLDWLVGADRLIDQLVYMVIQQ